MKSWSIFYTFFLSWPRDFPKGSSLLNVKSILESRNPIDAGLVAVFAVRFDRRICETVVMPPVKFHKYILVWNIISRIRDVKRSLRSFITLSIKLWGENKRCPSHTKGSERQTPEGKWETDMSWTPNFLSLTFKSTNYIASQTPWCTPSVRQQSTTPTNDTVSPIGHEIMARVLSRGLLLDT